MRVAALVTALSLVLVSPSPSDACGWVYYKGFAMDSPERKAIDEALTKKRWQQAKELVLAELAKADRHKEETKDEPGGWIWVGQGWTQYQLATAQFHLGEIDEAYASIKNALAAKRNWGADPAKYDQLFLLYGNIEFKRGNNKRAIQMVKRATRYSKRDPRLWSTLATYQEAAGQLRAAERNMKWALKLSPKHHGGMEWVHLEVIRFRRQLKRKPDSAADRPFLHAFEGKKSAGELAKARAFARKLAPELPIEPITGTRSTP